MCVVKLIGGPFDGADGTTKNLEQWGLVFAPVLHLVYRPEAGGRHGLVISLDGSRGEKYVLTSATAEAHTYSHDGLSGGVSAGDLIASVTS